MSIAAAQRGSFLSTKFTMAIDTPARIVIIGGGPIGVEAALYGRYLGYDVDLYEQARLFEAVRAWGDFPLNHSFAELSSPLGRAAIATQFPSHALPGLQDRPTAAQWLEGYLEPLSRVDLIVDSLHEKTSVTDIGRESWRREDGVPEEAGYDELFLVAIRRLETSDEQWRLADIVLDASGPVPAGSWGLGGMSPAGLSLLGEQHVSRRLCSGPELAERIAMAPRVLAVGTSQAMMSQLTELLSARGGTPLTELAWCVRESADALVSRLGNDGELGRRLREAIAAGSIELLSESQIASVRANTTPDCHAVRVDLLPLEPSEEEDDSDDDDENGASVYPDLAVRMITREFDLIWAPPGNSNRHWPELRLRRDVDLDCCEAMARWLRSEPTRPTSTDVVTSELNYYLIGVRGFGRAAERFALTDGLAQIQVIYSILVDRPNLDLYLNAPNPESA